MKWANYHTHSQYCDGKEELSDYVESAIAKGFAVLGFSGHAPLPFNTEWNIKAESLADYFDEIEQLQNIYKDKIQIYKSLEIDFVKDLTGINTFKQHKLDYTIGSIHFVGSFENGEYFGIDHTVEKFEKGLKDIFLDDVKELVFFYYKKVKEMISSGRPDVIGHFDIIKKFNKNNRFFDENQQWYREIVYDCLEHVAKNKCIVEVNTRGVLKKLCNDFYPSKWILQRCKLLNIPVMFSADAHHPLELDHAFPEVATMLKSIGIKEAMVFIDKKWKSVEFDENGLNV